MTLRHYQIFKTVAETNNFTKAAQKLYMSQSGVSHAIHEMEQRAGTILFDRLSKQVCLTKSGVLLLEEIIPILSSCEALEAHMTSLEKKAPIHIVSSITIASYWLPEILRKFEKEWENTPVEVEVVSAANAAARLHAGSADLALIEGIPPLGAYYCRTFSSYQLAVVCSGEYSKDKHTISIPQLCSERLLLREKGSAIRDTVDSTVYLSGYKVYPIWTSVNSMALIQAAIAGLGITILPEILVQEEIKKGTLVSLKVEDLELQNELTAVWHKNKYMTESFLSLLSYFS